MLFPEAQVRIWLYTDPTDMRKSYDGLSILVKQKLADDPVSGQLFVFINRKRTQMKVLYFDRSGYCIWSKRLEQGRFHFRSSDRGKLSLSWTDLKLIIGNRPANPVFFPSQLSLTFEDFAVVA